MHFVSGEAGIKLSGIFLTVPIGIVVTAIALLFCLWVSGLED